MVYTNLKNTAVALRKQGLSYSEIKERVPVSKSTLSKWFKEVKLSPVQRTRLKQKRTEAAKRGVEKKSAKFLQAIEEIQKNSGQEIGKISRRELWLLGILLYWKNGNKNDLKKGVHFSSSHPQMIRFFLKWLFDIGGLKKEEIMFDIFTVKNNGLVDYWSGITGFPKDSFSRIYIHKKRYKRSKRKIINKTEHGILRIRVRASSMLARQIDAWIDGLKNQIN